MIVLDACVCAEKIYHGWQDKLNGDFIGIDIRKGNFSHKYPSNYTEIKVIIKPTVLADMKFLPFQDSSIDSIVFDPPHMDCGLTGFMAKSWGSWTQSETIRTLRVVNDEFSRVLKVPGTIVLKIMPRSFPLYETLLKNFVFYLPIQTKRSIGAWKNKQDREAALWAVGMKKDIAFASLDDKKMVKT